MTKRFFAMGYDIFILVAISMAYSALATVFMHLALNIDADNYQPMQKGVWYQVGWLTSLAMFYWFFWYRGGQTVGMKTWRIQVVTLDGKSLSHWQCLVRIILGPFSLGLCAIGYFYALLDKEHLALHDRLSKTKVIALPKKEKAKKEEAPKENS